MKYVITGSLGHISQPIVSSLAAAGHEVSVITSNASRVADIEKLGAKALVGSLEDRSFVTNSFAHADALYLMIPPKFNVSDWRAEQNQVADNFVAAIKANNIRYAVVLSSIGAHLGNGAGPIDGLADLEKKLASIEGMHVKNLRPSYFFYNLFAMIPLVKHNQIMGSNFGNTEEKLVLTDTSDIAAVAIEELLSLNFKGQSVRYIASDECAPSEIAATLGAAVNMPGLPWVSFTDEQALEGMLQAGLPAPIAKAYTQMGKSIRQGLIQEDYWKNKPVLGKVKLTDFAKAFAQAYNN